jgi:anti-sigma28 factor (negative regulator of flagellin synthesis)
MRIDGSGPKAIGDAAPGARPLKGSEAPARAGEAVVVAAGTREAAELASRGAEARAEHVEAVRLRVESGTYKIDYDLLADRIVAEETDRGRG